MDLLLIVRDALASSLVGTLLAARDARDAGREVAVLVTGEALAGDRAAAPSRGRASSPGRRCGSALADRGKALGLPLLAKGEGPPARPQGAARRDRRRRASRSTRARSGRRCSVSRRRRPASRRSIVPGSRASSREAGKVVGSL